MRRLTTKTRRLGFTLVELLAVIIILGILMLVLLPRLMGASEVAKEQMTRTFFESIKASLAEYEDRFGDYPPSTFLEKWGTEPNATNRGGETLVLSLWSPEWAGTSLTEDKLVNTDTDDTRKSVTRFPKTSLFELADQFGNPIAYFHHRDYGRVDTYVTVNAESGVLEESTVHAQMSSTTKTYANPNTFQLISAGKNGTFGDGDDLFNFKSD